MAQAKPNYSKPIFEQSFTINSLQAQRVVDRVFRRTVSALYGIDVILRIIGDENEIDEVEQIISQLIEDCAKAVDNDYVGSKVDAMRIAIERGEGFTSSAKRTAMFSPLFMQMLAVGEETGRVDEMLAEVADFYEEEVEYKLLGLSSAIEPILISIIGVLVLILALGVFLPLWELSSAVNR